MAARDRFGGLAALTVSAMVVMRALFDVVVIETVGVGQSETDIAGAADTVILCLQPGSGDTLQFMKAGIVEIPQIMLVTKADLGEAAEHAVRDAAAALHQGGPGEEGAWPIPLLTVAAAQGIGIAALGTALDAHWAWLAAAGRLARQRQAQAEAWVLEAIRERFGREGLRRAAPHAGDPGESPFRRLAEVVRRLGG
jgi:LAO/AO transport system kinase